MYDIKRRVELPMPCTVAQIIEILQKYPQDAEVSICGDTMGFVHCETDNSVVTIDTEDLEECYE